VVVVVVEDVVVVEVVVEDVVVVDVDDVGVATLVVVVVAVADSPNGAVELVVPAEGVAGGLGGSGVGASRTTSHFTVRF
jgi:hypothetical protein